MIEASVIDPRFVPTAADPRLGGGSYARPLFRNDDEAIAVVHRMMAEAMQTAIVRCPGGNAKPVKPQTINAMAVAR